MPIKKYSVHTYNARMDFWLSRYDYYKSIECEYLAEHALGMADKYAFKKVKYIRNL